MSLISGPVSLMRLQEVDTIEEVMAKAIDVGNITVETKWNGWLVQSAGGRLYSRRGKELTGKFPHIARLVAPLTKEHLIGELVYFTPDGHMDEPSVTHVAGTKDVREAVRKLEELPGHFEYIVFDVLAAAGRDLSTLSLSDRRAILEECLSGTGLQISEPHPFDDWEGLYESGVAAGGDGVVFKNINAPYLWRPLGETEAKPSATWWKLKPVHTDDFVVYELTTGPKGRTILVFGQYHGGRLIPVGQVNNLSRDMEVEVTRRMKDGPFVVELEFLTRFPGHPGALQHPRFLRFREEKEPEDATLPDRHAPESPELGVALPTYQNYWVKPSGDVIFFPWNFSHDAVAQQEGFSDSNAALQAGLVRAYDGGADRAIAIQAWSLLDTQTLELVAGLVENRLAEKPDLEQVVIDTMVPRVVSFSVLTSDFENFSVSEAIEKGAIQAISGLRR
jgi:hypothetical protein